MSHALADFWDGAIAPYILQAKPRLVLMVGGGTLLTDVLAASAPWGGAVHLADRNPRLPPGVTPADLVRTAGDRFTLHRTGGKEAARLLPSPDLALIDGEPSWRGVTGVLYALRSQAIRTHGRFPITLLGQVAGPCARSDSEAGDDPRAGVVTAIEDFVAAHPADFSFAVLPVLGGLAVLAPLAAMADDPARALFTAIGIGQAAHLAVAAAEQQRAALAEENAALRRLLSAADYRNAKLHEALRLGQSAAAPAPQADTAARPVTALLASWLTSTGRRQPAASAQEEADIARLRESPILDASWYLSRHADAAAGNDAAAHYYRIGAAAGHDPGPAFDTAFYLARHPDVAQAGANPLLHFLLAGAAEGRDPSPDFDTGFYVRTYPDVAEAGHNPLEHYLLHGRQEGRRALPAV